MGAAPTVFISYVWQDAAHLRWVEALATRLHADGVNVWFDRWQLRPGAPLASYMETAIREADFVLVICTPAYKTASDQRVGGVGYEGDIVTGELLAKREQTKFIPLFRAGEWISAAPSWALGRAHVDFRGDPYPEGSYEILRNAIFGRYSGAEPLLAARTNRRIAGRVSNLTFLLAPPSTARRILAHFLDHYVLELSGYGRGNARLDRKIAAEATLAFRLALLVADEVLVPAVSYFQSPLCRRIVDRHRTVFDVGVIKLVGDAYGWEEFRENRLREYSTGMRQYEIYSAINPQTSRYPALSGSYRNTTVALHSAWRRIVVPAADELLVPVRAIANEVPFIGQVGTVVADLPEILGPRAFVAENAYDLLFGRPSRMLLSYLSALICSLFFGVLCEDFPAGYLDDLTYLRRTIPANAQFHLSYLRILRQLRPERELFADVTSCRPLDLLTLQNDPTVRRIVDRATSGG